MASTARYEAWLRTRVPVVERDLVRKHDEMRRSRFAFLRATFYRWMEVWPEECARLVGAPQVAAVGDLHVENFGTWRDGEGRLAWGVNDFDEAARLPYTSDLVRLATSAILARREERLGLTARQICRAILAGYAGALEAGGRPIVLAEEHRRLGERVVTSLVEPARFWTEKLGAALRPRPAPPASCRRVLARALPPGSERIRMRARVAGLGSLGHPRFVAVAEWHGARVAREAKAFTPSAALWAVGGAVRGPSTLARTLLACAIRCPDPFLAFDDGWIVRRLAPDSDKIRIAALDDLPLELELLGLMGWETANVHLASRRAAPRVRADLARRGRGWLRKAARRMLTRVDEDFRDWSRR